jgi:hypothetical protein
VLGAALVAVVSIGRRGTAEADSARPKTSISVKVAETQSPAAPKLRRQVIWLAAAFVPAGLLLATTNHLATDLVSAPLLWVGPLAMYLASFVVAFSERGRRILPAIDTLVPAAATVLWLPWIVPLDFPVLAILVLELASFFVMALAIHGRLALDRPDSRYLTRFYLILPAGGALATAFVALVAPIVFSSVYEYPFLIVAGLAVLAVLPAKTRPSRDFASLVRGSVRDLAPYAAVAVTLLVLGANDDRGIGVLIGILAAGGLAIAVARSPALLAPAMAVVILRRGRPPRRRWRPPRPRDGPALLAAARGAWPRRHSIRSRSGMIQATGRRSPPGGALIAGIAAVVGAQLDDLRTKVAPIRSSLDVLPATEPRTVG